MISLSDLSLIDLLPSGIKSGKDINALALSIDNQLKEITKDISNVILLPNIDELGEAVLDILAYDLHVDWYDYESPIEIKRKALKNSIKIHRRLGTKYAVESVISTYFGTGVVKEWFDYGGKPFHFKVFSDNPGITKDDTAGFLAMLKAVKRQSAHLDGIMITLSGEMLLTFGTVIKDTTHEFHAMGQKDNLDLLFGILLNETTTESYAMGSDSLSLL